MQTEQATQELKQSLVDAILMMERAGIIDFNGHFSARPPDSECMLINSGKSVRSALTAADIITIDMNGKPVDGMDAPPMEFHIHANRNDVCCCQCAAH